MLFCADSSADTITEELSKHLECAWLGPQFVYCESGSLVVFFEVKTYVRKFEIFDFNGYCHQFQNIDLKAVF